MSQVIGNTRQGGTVGSLMTQGAYIIIGLETAEGEFKLDRRFDIKTMFLF